MRGKLHPLTDPKKETIIQGRGKLLKRERGRKLRGYRAPGWEGSTRTEKGSPILERFVKKDRSPRIRTEPPNWNTELPKTTEGWGASKEERGCTERPATRVHLNEKPGVQDV